MNAGRLRNRVTIEAKTRTQDEYGGWSEAWSNHTPASAWAEIKPLKGDTLFQAQQVSSKVTHTLTLRTVAGLTPNHRMKLGARIFAIDHLVTRPERGEMELLCHETL